MGSRTHEAYQSGIAKDHAPGSEGFPANRYCPSLARRILIWSRDGHPTTPGRCELAALFCYRVVSHMCVDVVFHGRDLNGACNAAIFSGLVTGCIIAGVKLWL